MEFKTLPSLAIYAPAFVTPPYRNFYVFGNTLYRLRSFTSGIRCEFACEFLKKNSLSVRIFHDKQLLLLKRKVAFNQIPSVLIQKTMFNPFASVQ